jgi:hypothetical protein
MHLFLQLMPYSRSAPYDYRELQDLVYHALAHDDVAQCLDALEQLASLYDHGLGEMPKRHDLLAEVASLVRQQHFSCLAAEMEFVARLDVLDISLDEFKVQGETAGVPMLVGSVRWVHGVPRAITGALRPVEECVAVLTAMTPQDLASMSVRERMAAIRLVRLFSLFGSPMSGAPAWESRGHFFHTLGLPVWRELARPGFGGEPADLGMYGEPAIRRIELALASGCGEADGVHQYPLSCVVGERDQPTRTASDDAAMHLFVAQAFPASRDSDDNALLKEYDKLRSPMPVARMPTTTELNAKHSQLKEECRRSSCASRPSPFPPA